MNKTTRTTKKVLTAGLATVIAASTAMAGTLAWQSLNQRAVNVIEGVVNPGGRLHDDFDGKEDKNIYVENFGTTNIFARVRLSELLVRKDGITEATLTYADAEADPKAIINIPEGNSGNINLTDSANYVPYDFENKTSQADKYWEKVFGGDSVSYIPTFNMDKNSFAADLNGVPDYDGSLINHGEEWDTYQTALTDGMTSKEIYNAIEDETMVKGETLTATAIGESSAADAATANTTESEYVFEVKNALHSADTTISATVMTMDEWVNDYNSEKGPYWVYDTDGWFYWAQPIEPGYMYDYTYDEDGNITSKDEAGNSIKVLVPTDKDNTTGPLLNALVDLGAIDEDYVYAINVDGQFVTMNDLGDPEANDGMGSGFYDTSKGSAPSDEALKLLEAIGAVTPAEEESEGGEEDDEGEDDGSTISLMIGTEYLGNPHTYYISAEEFKNTGIAFSAEFSNNRLSSEEASWNISGDNVEGSFEDDSSTYYVKYTGDEISGSVTFYIECVSTYGTSTSEVTVFTSATELTTAFVNGGTIDLGGNTITTTADNVTEDYTANAQVGSYYYAWTAGGDLSNGTLKMGSGETERSFTGLYVEAVNDSSSISNFTVNAEQQTAPIHIHADNDVTLNNVSVTGNRGGIYVNGGSGTTILTEVSIDASNAWDIDGYEWYNSAIGVSNGANLVVESGTYSGEHAIYIMSSGGDVTIYDGKFEGKIVVTAGTLTIYGGTFTVNPSDYVPVDYTVTPNDDGTWTVS
ncbi:MAG: hypothetical protein IJX14_04550 [Clostridia bacterium]|nr:hypothetical protein [Clostridia bacterium]